MKNPLNLDSDEKILLEVRKHWFVFSAPALMFFIGVLGPLIIYFIFYGGFLVLNVDSLAQQNFYDFIVRNIPKEFFLYCIWVLILWVLFAFQWTNYYLDVWYVTDKRIIDFDQRGIFHRHISNLRFDKIQDVSVEVKGLVATFLNFGDIHVQTASEDSKEFFIKHATDPETAKKVIFSQHHRVSEKHQQVRIVKDEKEIEN